MKENLVNGNRILEIIIRNEDGVGFWIVVGEGVGVMFRPRKSYHWIEILL